MNVTGPVILGFFPPYSESEEEEDGVIEGLAHVRYALEHIGRCFGGESATYRLDVTKSVTLRDGRRVERIRRLADRSRTIGRMNGLLVNRFGVMRPAPPSPPHEAQRAVKVYSRSSPS